MRAKPKQFLQITIVVICVFIIYKLLRYDISHQSEYFNYDGEDANKNKNGGRKESHKETFGKEDSVRSKEDRVRSLVGKYKLDWEYELLESPWDIAAGWMTDKHVLPEHTPQLGAIMKSMATRKVTSADVGYKGTQLKLLLVLEGGQKVAFKPKRFSRDHVIEGLPYSGEDRHNGEIAAFHLSRLLGFRLTPVAVGHQVNLEHDIKPVSSPALLATFYKRDNNTCFYGKCYYCKGEATGVCGQGDQLEGTLILWLPDWASLKVNKHPWARTYRTAVLAQWEDDDNYCKKVLLQHPEYYLGPRLLDIIDTMVLDFLIGNADRHHYETIGDGHTATMLMLDNAKSFGNPHEDEMSILAPLTQCCRLRQSTWSLLQEYEGGVLSEVLQTVMAADQISPVLSPLHLQALDRRLTVIVDNVKQCIVKRGVQNVLINNR